MPVRREKACLAVLKGAAAGLCLALSGTAAVAEGMPTDAEREAFIAAIVANGCQMTEDEAPEKLPAAGIDQDTSGKITEMLVDEGLAELSDDGTTLMLTTEGCAP